MKFVLTIPASGGHAEADLTIDGNAKVQAVKAVRALGNFGLKTALELVNEFLAQPDTAAEGRLIKAIVTNRRNPQDVHDDLHSRNVQLRNELTILRNAHSHLLDELASLRDALRREQDEVEMLRRTIHDLREQDNVQANVQARMVREAQDEGFPVVYHGSIAGRHGIYTAFFDNQGTYRLVHPTYSDESLEGVSWNSFTGLRGCEV